MTVVASQKAVKETWYSNKDAEIDYSKPKQMIARLKKKLNTPFDQMSNTSRLTANNLSKLSDYNEKKEGTVKT